MAANFYADFQRVATAFIEAYYKLFQDDRAQIHTLYHPDYAFLTFEGEQFSGRDQILGKYNTLPFQNVAVAVTKVDSQPTVDGGILIMVIGQLKADADPPHSFSQLFHLKPTVEGGWVIANDVFRLALHNF